MKTYRQFIFEASATHQLKIAVARKLAKRPDNVEVYKKLLQRIREREAPHPSDAPGRQAARRDKYLIPSYRTSSFPELAGMLTQTQDHKKLRKQRALGEIS